MNDCIITLNIEGETINFTSDKDLDAYLYRHQDRLMELLKIENLDITSQINENQNNPDGMYVYFDKLITDKNLSKRTTASPSMMWKMLGKSHSFDQVSDYEKWCKSNDIPTSDVSKSATYKQYTKDKEIHRVCGTYVHNCIEAGFNPLVEPKTNSYIDSPMVEAFPGETVADVLKKALDAQFGKDKWTPVSEIEVVSNFLDETSSKEITESEKKYLQGIIQSQLPESEKMKAKERLTKLQKDAIARVKGRIDLVVFDDNGYVHLFDYKTYSSAFGDQKEKEALYQLITYANILEQAGFKVKTINIVPIKLKIENKKAIIENLTIKVIEEYNLTNIRTDVDKYIPTPNKKSSLDSLGKSGTLIGEIYPETNINAPRRRKNADVENYLNNRKFLKNVLEGDSGWDTKKGTAVKYFYDKLQKKRIYIYDSDTEDDIKAKVLLYVESINKAREQEIHSFGKLISKSVERSNLEFFKNSLAKREDKDAETNLMLEYSFRKYIVNGWKLTNDEVLIDNGILIFEKNGRYEVVVLDVENLNAINQMLHKNTVLGNRRINVDLQDSSSILDSRNGHLLLMKVMIFLNENSELIKGKIQNIKAIDIFQAEELSVPLKIIQDNYNLLKATYLDLELPTLKQNIFMDDTHAYVLKARDWINAFQANKDAEYLKISKVDKKINEEYTREEIRSIITNFVRSTGVKSFDNIGGISSWVFPTFYELLQAYFSTFDINLFTEIGLGRWFTGASFNGTESVPFSASTSGIIKQLDDVNADYNTAVRLQFEKEIKPWQLMIKKILAKPNNSNKSNNTYFSSWFSQTNGVINNEFVIKHLDSFVDPDEKAAAKYLLDTLAKYRGWDQNKINTECKKPGSEYYQIPLIKSTVVETIQSKGSVITAMKDWFDKISEMDYEKALGLALTDDQKRKIYGENLDVLELDNVMLHSDPKHREDLLSNGINNYSHDLDKIFGITLSHSIRTNMSSNYLPIFTGFRVWLEMANSTNLSNAEEISNITSAVTDWIKKNVFGRSLIDSHEVFVLKISKIIRQLTSGVTLAFTMTGGARELLVSSMVNFMGTKDWSDPDIKSFEVLAKAYCDTIAQLSETTDILSKDQQLNSLYGAAGIDIYQLGENNRVNKWNLKNMTGDWLYVVQQAPDYFHRLSYLKAKLMARNSYDAYSMSEDGVLIYDFEKDDYYAIYRKYANVDPALIPKDDYVEFCKKKDDYIAAIKSWKNLSGYETLEVGQSLPQALSPEEMHGVHVNCNLMHGFYNSDSKTLLQQTLYGGLLFQFKTVPLARMVKLFHPAEAINVKTSFPVVDPKTGSPVWINANNDMKLEDDISDEDIANGFKPFRVRQGNPLVGTAIASVDTIMEMYKVGLKGDPELWKNYMENPWKKRAVYLALWELFGMAILQWLVSLAHPEATQNLRKAHWLERFSYTVLNGAVTDIGVFNVLSSVIGDGAPPSFSIVQKWVDNTMSVIFGDMNPIYAMLNTFGATKPLSNIAYAW